MLPSSRLGGYWQFSFLVSSFEVLIFIYSLRSFGGRAKPEDTQLSHLYSWSSLRARGGTELVGIPFLSSAWGGFCCRAAWGWWGLESSEEVKTSVCAVFCSCPCSSLLIQERDLGWMEALQLFFFFFEAVELSCWNIREASWTLTLRSGYQRCKDFYCQKLHVDPQLQLHGAVTSSACGWISGHLVCGTDGQVHPRFRQSRKGSKH